MDYSQKPLFRHGISAAAKLFFFFVASVCLLAIDSRVRLLEPLRQVVSTALYPIQRALLLPRDAAYSVSDYFGAQNHLLKQNETLRRAAVAQTQRESTLKQVEAENAQLRRLLELRSTTTQSWQPAEILYEMREAKSHRVVIDKGSIQNIAQGMPVMDEVGVIGQVVRVFPLSSEVNLITDRNQAVPVQFARNKLRAVAYGGIEGDLLEIRFMAANADVQVGDELYTSGIDGVYPAGLPVAKVMKVDKDTAEGFAKIICQPLAGLNRHKHVVVMASKIELPAPPPTPVLDPQKTKKRGAK